MSLNNILIVDDEDKIREFIGLYFRAEGFNVLEASDGREALHLFNLNIIDLIILDIMMPEIDGFEICKMIRKTSDVPIIILTALTEDIQNIHGYDLGADDYVSKHVSPKIIVAKAKRLLEKSDFKSKILTIGSIKIDKAGMCVYIDGASVDFSPKEFSLLLLLAENKNKVLSRECIPDKVWGYDFIGETRVVDTHIKKIRKKLGKHFDMIKTMVSLGYKIEDK